MNMSDKPSPAEVVYAGPNLDGSRKRCENCFAWVKGKNRCIYFKNDISVKKDDICNLHVYGRPRTEWTDKGIDPLDPDSVGFVKSVGDGTSCDTCKAYDYGYCKMVEVDGKSAKVDKLGCCARWTRKGDPDLTKKSMSEHLDDNVNTFKMKDIK